METYKLAIKKNIQLSLSKVNFCKPDVREWGKGDFQDVMVYILVRKVLKSQILEN